MSYLKRSARKDGLRRKLIRDLGGLSRAFDGLVYRAHVWPDPIRVKKRRLEVRDKYLILGVGCGRTRETHVSKRDDGAIRSNRGFIYIRPKLAEGSGNSHSRRTNRTRGVKTQRADISLFKFNCHTKRRGPTAGSCTQHVRTIYDGWTKP